METIEYNLPRGMPDYLLPHTCPDEQFYCGPLDEIDPGRIAKVVVMERSTHDLVNIGTWTRVYIYQGRCDKCGQEYQSWTWEERDW